VLEDPPTLFLPIKIYFFIQEYVEVSMGASMAFGDHCLAATLLYVSQKFLIVRVKGLLFFERT
jgi:hypothetical protein